MNEYMHVKTAATRAYGSRRAKAPSTAASGATAFSQRTTGLCSADPRSATATASRMGPRIMTLKYSVKRRPKFRRRSTRHTKLMLPSTFWIVAITVYKRNARPMEPSSSPRMFATNCMMLSVSCVAAPPTGRRNSWMMNRISPRAPMPLSIAKLNTSKGTRDSRVV